MEHLSHTVEQKDRRVQTRATRWGGCLAFVVLLGWLPGAAANVFHNGSFTYGSLGWESEGPADFQNGFAQLTDANDATLARTFQFVSFTGEGTLSFELRADVSTAVPFGTSPDTVFISLYFVDDPASFDLDAGQFADALGLLQIDRNGGQVLGGALSAGTLGPGWQTFSVDIVSTNVFVIPVVELFGANGVDADSAVLVDDFRMRVDRADLNPRITSMEVRAGEGQVRLEFADPKGREDSFNIESTLTIEDPDSWAVESSPAIRCPTPGHFEGDLALPGDPPGVVRFYRINPK